MNIYLRNEFRKAMHSGNSVNTANTTTGTNMKRYAPLFFLTRFQKESAIVSSRRTLSRQ
jgi:hypothetical protein